MIGVFTNESAFSIMGNKGLCGGIVELGLPKCKEINKQKKKLPDFVIVILIASALFTTIYLAYAWCKKRNKNKISPSLMNEGFITISYNQLLKATNRFSEANLIGNAGSSSVYKGIFNFMPKWSLHEWLHSGDDTSRLNLLQITNTRIDFASALDYIYNYCLPPIVHGDLKPSNILLNYDMVAHVGDFGLARFLGTTSYQNSSIGIRGTIGYAAPEYGLGSEMTSSGDIYSFGILILEVLTRKRPTDDIFKEGLSLHKFASMVLPNHVIDVINVDILKVCQENETNIEKLKECLASIIKIGVSCSLYSPQQRMDIKKVVHELQHILNTLQNIEGIVFNAKLPS
ncbi:hypothetical protein L1987_25433 [Smallanthus sonchifolius]|uniref:Uncharacterized protein n=1 Tax=Smallanthus sonchifolius TaxID=185202 RepID=A0ACB9IQV9_9ASTR|nr:hypothetical protein L1987_25433 [Smallanthus sonchifolius]